MPDVLVDGLVAERDGLVSRIQALKDAAVDSARDLSADDLESIEKCKARIAKIDGQLAAIGDDLAMPDDVRARLSRVTKRVSTPSAYRSSGEVLYDLLHQNDPDAQARYGAALKRAAEHMGTDAATTVPVAGDLGGLIVSPVVGPVINPVPTGMPFLTGVGWSDMPGAFSFTRPFIVDPDYATGVGQQGTGGQLGFEKAELPSKAFNIDSDALKATTIGGYLNVSQQLISLQAGSLTVIVDQLNWRLARALDAFALTEAQQSTGHVDLPADADGPTVLAAIFDASVAVYEATMSPAEWIAMGPKGWARLGSLTDLAGRPLLPTLGPANAMGSARADSLSFTGPAGLRPIVTPGIDDDTFLVGNRYGLETYLYRYPVLEAVEPSVLGRQVAVAASIVSHRPTPTANSVITVGPPAGS